MNKKKINHLIICILFLAMGGGLILCGSTSSDARVVRVNTILNSQVILSQ